MKKSMRKTLMWFVIGCIFLCVSISAILFFIMDIMLDIHVSYSNTWEAKDFGLDATHFFLKTEDDLNISTYEVAVDSPKAVIICLSGIHFPTPTIYFGHAQLFKEQNFATIMLDMRSHGKSDGNKIYVGYKEWLDVKVAVAYVKDKPLYNNVPVFVFGLSMGGATAINAIGEIADIDGLISLSAFSSWEEVFYQRIAASFPTVITKIAKPFISLATWLKFGKVSRMIKPKRSIEKLGDRPALLMHTIKDSQVPYKSFEILLNHAPSHVETFIREGDNHFVVEKFVNPNEDEEYKEKIIQFLNKNITVQTDDR